MEKIDISHRHAFNIIYHESILIFQDGVNHLPFLANISPDNSENSLSKRIQLAYDTIMRECPPDSKRSALLIGESCSEFDEIADALQSLGVQQLYICREGNKIVASFPFISEYNPETWRYYPSAILDNLFLGPASCLSDEEALVDLGEGIEMFPILS